MLSQNIAGQGANSVDPAQTPHSAASDLGLHCSLRPVWHNTLGYYRVSAANHSKAIFLVLFILCMALWLLVALFFMFCSVHCLIVVFGGSCLLSFQHDTKKHFFAWHFILNVNILF